MVPVLGSGPYKVGNLSPGRFIEYERVPDYWAADLPISRGFYNFDVIRVEFYRERQAAFEASLVYALVGDETAALVNAERARDLGFAAPAWFRLPWFEPLLADPAFRRLAARRASPV